MHRYLAVLIAAVLLTASAEARSRNLIAGTWMIVSAKGGPPGATKDLFGADPQGQLIFTRDLHFAVVIDRRGVPAFAKDARNEGTASENKAAMAGALALFGTYAVDAEGRFASEHVIGSNFPNWVGLDRTNSSLTETPEGDRMIERLRDPGKPLVEIVWRRVR